MDLRETSKPGPVSRRATVHESSTGLRMAWNPGEGMAAGASLLWTRLDRPVASGATFGKTAEQLVTGCDISLMSGLASLSAEGARTSGGYAMSGRVGYALSPTASISIGLWYCSPGFRNAKAGSTVRGNDLTNDAGAEVNATCSPLLGMTCSLNLVSYKKPWRTYGDRMPPEGSDLSVKVAQRVAQGLSLSGTYRSVAGESWERLEQGGQLLRWTMGATLRRSCTAAVDCLLTREIHLSTQFGRVWASSSGANGAHDGWMVSQELYATWRAGTSIGLRWTTMGTDAYTSRVYIFERTVDGGYSAPALSGTGLRWYVFFRTALLRGFVISGRYAETWGSTGPLVSLREHTLVVQCDADLAALLRVD